MDQIKIGKFIQEKRKEKNLTQCVLAEKLRVSDRAVSKWENGVCLPDVGIMPELCQILSISINDLFSGEVVKMKDNEKKLEENLLEVAKLKEENDKRLLHLEVVIGVLSVIIFLTFTMMSAYLEIDTYLRVIFFIFGTLVLVVCALYAVRLEQIAGYYECSCCHHKYVPTYKSVNLAMHMGRTRYMKCPKCGKKSWQKKVLK